MMVAASPVLTTNALARMLEERPDPSAFQPVLQIAGNCFVYVFFIIKRVKAILVVNELNIKIRVAFMMIY